MKLSKSQIKKANSKIALKYNKASVELNNDLKDTRVVYTELSYNEMDKYVFDFIKSLLHTENNFNDLYYSI